MISEGVCVRVRVCARACVRVCVCVCEWKVGGEEREQKRAKKGGIMKGNWNVT